MNTLKPLLCLFLCLHPVYSIDFESEITTIEQSVHSVNQKEASSLSKKIQGLLVETGDDLIVIQKQIKKREAQHKRVYVKRLTRAKKRYRHWQHRLETCQTILHERFHESYQTYQPGGFFNPDALIQGEESLPEYGGYAPLQSKQKGCPEFDVSNLEHFSAFWQPMVENGTISAGTWAYPGGGMHLGLDVAAPLYSHLYAPANGIVLYADAPVDSNNGYLGNYCGWPQGGGNTIATIMAVNETLYGVTFAHLSNQIHVVAGQSFQQGTLLAQTGNSGNSTGPHVHIEIFQIKTDLQEAISYFQQGADFSFGNGFSAPATCSYVACRIRPESVL